MGRYAKEPEGGGDYEHAPQGTHLGICYRLYDIGTQHKEFDGEVRTSRDLWIAWELPNELMGDGRPFSVTGFYTNSLHEKAKLRAHLESWRGRAFTEAELKGFDLNKVLGVPCLVTVGYSKNGKERVTAVAALLKGMTAPKPTNEVFSFWIEEWDEATWQKIPDGIKKKIQESDEYKALKGIVPENEESWPDEPPSEEGTPF